MKRALPLALVTFAALASPAGAEPAAPTRPYSPYAGRSYPTQVFWGDTHRA